MPPPTIHQQVQTCSLQLSEHGDGFVMDLVNSSQETVRLEFPAWVLHQLMRTLPRIDAALQHGAPGGRGGLLAYPLEDWNVESAGGGLGVALHLRNDRQVDAAFHLPLEAAIALHRELGEAIVRESRSPLPGGSKAMAN